MKIIFTFLKFGLFMNVLAYQMLKFRPFTVKECSRKCLQTKRIRCRSFKFFKATQTCIISEARNNILPPRTLKTKVIQKKSKKQLPKILITKSIKKVNKKKLPKALPRLPADTNKYRMTHSNEALNDKSIGNQVLRNKKMPGHPNALMDMLGERNAVREIKTNINNLRRQASASLQLKAHDIQNLKERRIKDQVDVSHVKRRLRDLVTVASRLGNDIVDMQNSESNIKAELAVLRDAKARLGGQVGRMRETSDRVVRRIEGLHLADAEMSRQLADIRQDTIKLARHIENLVKDKQGLSVNTIRKLGMLSSMQEELREAANRLHQRQQNLVNRVSMYGHYLRRVAVGLLNNRQKETEIEEDYNRLRKMITVLRDEMAQALTKPKGYSELLAKRLLEIRRSVLAEAKQYRRLSAENDVNHRMNLKLRAELHRLRIAAAENRARNIMAKRKIIEMMKKSGDGNLDKRTAEEIKKLYRNQMKLARALVDLRHNEDYIKKMIRFYKGHIATYGDPSSRVPMKGKGVRSMISELTRSTSDLQKQMLNLKLSMKNRNNAAKSRRRRSVTGDPNYKKRLYRTKRHLKVHVKKKNQLKKKDNDIRHMLLERKQMRKQYQRKMKENKPSKLQKYLQKLKEARRNCKDGHCGPSIRPTSTRKQVQKVKTIKIKKIKHKPRKKKTRHSKKIVSPCAKKRKNKKCQDEEALNKIKLVGVIKTRADLNAFKELLQSFKLPARLTLVRNALRKLFGDIMDLEYNCVDKSQTLQKMIEEQKAEKERNIMTLRKNVQRYRGNFKRKASGKKKEGKDKKKKAKGKSRKIRSVKNLQTLPEIMFAESWKDLQRTMIRKNSESRSQHLERLLSSIEHLITRYKTTVKACDKDIAKVRQSLAELTEVNKRDLIIIRLLKKMHGHKILIKGGNKTIIYDRRLEE